SNTGACGVITDSNGVWLSTSLYGGGSHCGESIQVKCCLTCCFPGSRLMHTSSDNGRTVMVKVSVNGIGLAADVFQQLGSLDKGIIPVTWNYM
ncbi:hypothetical protein EDD18DRAFT_1073020, partial [Armillaria luteobubalina]